MRTAPDAYIVDAVRTPRGRGKAEVGALSGLTPLWLLRGVLQGLQRRLDLDTATVDDVVIGCVTPVGEQGGCIARTAVLDAGWARSVAGLTQSRFCASGLESVNLAAATQILAGGELQARLGTVAGQLAGADAQAGAQRPGGGQDPGAADVQRSG